MMKFVVNLATCSVLMTAVSLLYVWLSDKLKDIWSAKTRCFLWIFVIIGFLTPFKPRIIEPAFNVILDSNPINKMSDIDYGAPNYFHINNTKMNVFMLLFAVWLLGFMFSAVRYIIRQQQFQGHVKRMSKPGDDTINAVAEEIARETGITELRVVVLPTAQSPMMTGFNAPMIILPKDDYSDDELKLILKHELTHFKRHDLIFKFFVLACKAIHWFNPFMSYISNKIDEVCELACDETVIADEEKEGRKLYCQSILSAVMITSQEKTFKPAVSSDFGNPHHDLQHRLRMIINAGKKKRLGIVCVMVVLLIALSSVIFGVSYFEAESSELSWVTTTAVFSSYMKGEEPTAVSAQTTTYVWEEAETATAVTGGMPLSDTHAGVTTTTTTAPVAENP